MESPFEFLKKPSNLIVLLATYLILTLTTAFFYLEFQKSKKSDEYIRQIERLSQKVEELNQEVTRNQVKIEVLEKELRKSESSKEDITLYLQKIDELIRKQGGN